MEEKGVVRWMGERERERKEGGRLGEKQLRREPSKLIKTSSRGQLKTSFEENRTSQRPLNKN